MKSKPNLIFLHNLDAFFFYKHRCIIFDEKFTHFIIFSFMFAKQFTTGLTCKLGGQLLRFNKPCVKI